MSKRGAEEYITKEHGSTPNSTLEEAKVKMATAAQMAKRKMAVPKSRAGRSGHSPMPGAGSSNPFASTTTFGAPQQQSFSSPGAVSFGTSQSFPPGESTSNSNFSFSVPGQSSSFTFGQPAPNNPFASLNGGADNQQQAGQDSGDAMMESPQKKPAFGSSLFSSGNTDTSAQPPGFSFGPTAGQLAFSFGKSQPESQPQTNGFGGNSTSSVFGQNSSKPQEPSTTANIFGQSIQSQSNPPATNSIFGQNINATQTNSQPSTFSFGQPTTASAPSSKPAFSFGQTSSQPSSSGALFGGLTQTSQPAFGASTPASQSVSSTPLFGAAPAPSTSNVFGEFGSPKPSESTPTPEPPSQPLFGQPQAPASSEEAQATSATVEVSKGNPFASLFGPKPAESAPGPVVNTPKPLFNFASSTQPSGSFNLPAGGQESTSKPVGETLQKPLFSFGSPTPVPNTKEPPPSSNPFASLSAKKSEPIEEDKGKPVFGNFKSAPSKPAGSFQSLPAFGSTSTAELPSSGTPVSALFGSSERSTAATPSTGQKRQSGDSQSSASEPAQQTPLFGSVTSKAQEPSRPSYTDMPASTSKAALAVPAKPSQATPIDDAPTRAVNTNPPTRIPPYLNGDDYKAYDSNYRLHSLNREFQKRIASLDPSRNDFENIVRNYVAARESIGESIGLYTRNVAGMKRKADGEDDRRDGDQSSSKKPRPDEETGFRSAFATNPSASSVFAPVPSSSSKSSANSMAASPSKKSSSASSNASSLFDSMIPKSNTQPGSIPNNPFADLAKSSTDTAEIPAKPVFSFGNASSRPPATDSTTPTKSPPKKPAFEMPKFSAPAGGSFMDAFKKQSEASAKKFADEAREKRKAEDFDSEDDDEEEWNRKYEEEEKAKRDKVAAVSQQGFAPVFGTGAPPPDRPIFGFGTSAGTTTGAISSSIFGSQTFGNSSDEPIDISDNDADGERDEETGSGDSGSGDNDDEEADPNYDDDLPEDDIEDDEEENEEDEDLETAMARSRQSKGKSLFERVTPNPKMQKTAPAESTNGVSARKEKGAQSSVLSSSVANSTPEAPSFSPLTPAGSKGPFVPSKTFNFTPTPPTTSSTPTPGASIFAGGFVKDGPVTGEGLFGSRPGTPSNVFGGLGTPSASNTDQTWKKGSEIKFGLSDKDAPTVSVTEATPKKEQGKPFGSLFGANAPAANGTASGSGIGFSFGQSPVPGFLAAASHLGGGSGTTSGLSSRATSPGTTDNESVATNEEDFSNDAQVSLMETRPGEEHETVINETRARAMRYYTEEQIAGTKFEKGWNGAGLGVIRLLKHKETGKTRVVMRAEPGANIILNTNLQPEVKYEAVASGNNGSVKFSVFTNEGVQSWLLKVKTLKSAEELAKIMEENKTACA